MEIILSSFMLMLAFWAVAEGRVYQYSVYDCDPAIVENIVDVTRRIEQIPCVDVKFEKTAFAPSFIRCAPMDDLKLGFVVARQYDKYNFIMVIKNNITSPMVRDNVIVHEFGHVMGLGHDCENGGAMKPEANVREPQFFNEKEINELREYFPVYSPYCENLHNFYSQPRYPPPFFF